MAQVDSLEIQITSSSKVAEQSLDSLVATLEKLRSQLGYSTESARRLGNSSTYFNNLNNSLKTSSKHAFSLAAAFGKFYASYFLIIRGMKQLWSSIESTTDYIEAFNYQNVALGKIASDWKDQYAKYGYDSADAYAESFGSRLQDTIGKLSGIRFDEEQLRLVSSETKSLGLNLKEVTQYASQLESVTNSVGQTAETSLAASTAFTKLSGDISSLFNVDYSTVATNLQSGLIGQSRALYKYGIDITNATLQTKAYELGLEKAVSEMTQAEKMQLRMIAILDQSKVSWGDLANTINSPSNMIRQFKTNLEEAGMVLGQLFVPVLQKVLPFLNGVSIAFKQLLVDIAGFLGVEIDMDSFGTGFNEMEDDLSGIEDGFDGATESAKKFKSQLQGFDKLNVLSTSTSGTAGSLNNTIDLTQQILEATKEYESVWNEAYEKMQNKAQEWAKSIEKSFGNVKKLFKDISVGDWVAVGQDVSNIVSGIFDSFSRAIEKVDWEQLGENIADFLYGVNWEQILRSVGNFLKKLWDAAVSVWSSSFETAPFETALLTALGLLTFTPLGTFLATSIANEFTKAMGTKPVADIMSAGLKSALGSEAAKSALVFMGSSLGTVFANAFVGAFAVVGSLFYLKLGEEEGKILDKETEIRNKYGNKYSDVEYAMMSSGGDSAFDRIATFDYVNKAAEHQVRVAQVDMIKNLGKGIVDLFDRMFKGGWTPFGGYATGGFPEDGWFRASHGEYFGKFDNGQSVIANNKQIVSGIANGVRDANMEQNKLLREQNALLRQILAKDTGISSRDVFNAVRSENKAYINRNGVSALA